LPVKKITRSAPNLQAPPEIFRMLVEKRTQERYAVAAKERDAAIKIAEMEAQAAKVHY
jgi:hypothetical protein